MLVAFVFGSKSDKDCGSHEQQSRDYNTVEDRQFAVRCRRIWRIACDFCMNYFSQNLRASLRFCGAYICPHSYIMNHTNCTRSSGMILA